VNDRQDKRARLFLALGVLLIGLSFVTNEWTISHLLTPDAPLRRVSSRLVSWLVTLNALCLGLWLIAWRRTIRPATLLALCFSYALFLALFLGFDLLQSYRGLRKNDGTERSGRFMMKDEWLGWKPLPGGTATVKRAGEYDAAYAVDAQGFRKTPEAVSPELSIYLFGDSFTFGNGVNDDETFPSRMAAALKGRVRVCNAGVPGYGITQMYARLVQLQTNLQPGDIVVFAPISEDIARNWQEFDFPARLLFWDEPIEHFPIFEGGSVRVQRVNTFANRWKAILQGAPLTGGVFRRLLPRVTADTTGDAVQMVELAGKVTEMHGAKFLPVFLPCQSEHTNTGYTRDVSRFTYVDVRDRFPKAAGDLDRLYYGGDGHFNPAGNRFVGELLVQVLVERGLLPPDFRAGAN